MTEQTEGAEVEALAEELHRAFHDAWPGPSVPLDLYADSPIWRSQARTVAAREATAEARGAQAVLNEAADAWTQGAWSDVMLPKPTPPAVPVIAYSNRVGDWLRARAARVAPSRVPGEET